MTAKEALKEAVDALTEDEAATWLARLRARGHERPLSVVIAEIVARIPPEEWDRIPQSSDIDEVVYGDPHGTRQQ